MRLTAFRAGGPHQSLGHHRHDRISNQKRLGTHVNQPRVCTWRIVRMQCAENQVARVRRLNGNVRGLPITNLTDHNHVRILPQEMSKHMGERPPDVALDGHLVDAL